jgi:hypothetical protein
VKCVVSTLGLAAIRIPYFSVLSSQSLSLAVFQSAGMAAGVISGCLLGFLAAYTIIILVRVEKHLVLDRQLKTRLTYPEVVAIVFERPANKRNYHEIIVYVNVVVTCLGACMAYCIFIIQTLPQVITALQTVSWLHFSTTVSWICSYVVLHAVAGGFGGLPGPHSLGTVAHVSHSFLYEHSRRHCHRAGFELNYCLIALQSMSST